jgi:protein-S-isoprenylcysteine O-methyltransferase Ste14
MPTLTRVFQLLPVGVFVWMIIGASIIFTRNAGARDPRGIGIALSMWGTLGAKGVATTPALWVQVTGAAGLLLTLALFQWAALSIRGRMFSYAGNHDLPQFVHSSGPYAYIRNPFYLSYLLAELFTVVMWPSALGAGIVVLAAIYFQWLARYEEEKFARSPVAAEYAEYKARTGRLLPRFR